MSNNPQNCRSLEDPSWDLGHEGHSGYLAINIANQLLEGWLRTAQPEIVMFMLGTNDVFQGRSQADILAAYTRIVELSRASNPNMKIIVSSLLPFVPRLWPPILDVEKEAEATVVPASV